ncbi:MAG: mechanosensitive ion channel family protein [Polymorphobacter sp.]
MIETTPAAAAKPDLAAQVEHLAVDTFGWLRTDSREALVAVGVAVAVYFAFFGLRWAIVRVLGEGHPVTSWRGFTRRIVRRTRSPFIAVFSAFVVTHLIVTPGPLQRAIEIAFTIAFAVQGALWVREVLLALVDRRAAESEDKASLDSAINIIRVLVNVVVWILAVILILDNLGVNVTALVAGLGVGGIAIGLAAQGIFSDLFAALSILFDRPFRAGDTIRFGEVTGTVEAIGLKTTRIRAITGEQVIVSNTKLLDLQIRNLRRIEARTTVMTFHLDLGSETAGLAGVPAMLTEVLAPMSHVEMKRAHVTAVTATSIEVEVEFTVEDASLIAMLNTKQMVLLGALDGFRALGLAMADSTPKVAAPAPVAAPAVAHAAARPASV